MRDSVLGYVVRTFRSAVTGRPKGLHYVLLAALSVSCATNPATGERQLSFVSEEREIAMGQENDTQIAGDGSYDDRALQEYVTTVGMKLAMNSGAPACPGIHGRGPPAINASPCPAATSI
jgi:predicted Zn-dependent protease